MLATWNQQDFWNLSRTQGTHLRLTFPQIYCEGQTKEWQQISDYGPSHNKGVHSNDEFIGDLIDGVTEAGCQGEVGPYLQPSQATAAFVKTLQTNSSTSQSNLDDQLAVGTL